MEQKHKDDQLNVVQEEGYKDLFYEEYNQHVINFVSDGFKKVFIPPIYDEYEEDCLDVMPKKPAVDFVSSGPVNEENSIAIQGQRAENREDSECAGSGNLPLSYSSFELLRHILQIAKQK